MRENLIESFENHLARIRTNYCVIVETPTGYYHSYDKAIIKERIKRIQEEIFRLTYSPQTRAIMALRK